MAKDKTYFQPTIRDLAVLLNDSLNDGRLGGEGFILVRFSHRMTSRPEFIATCASEDVCSLLRLVIGQIEGRIEGTEGNA